ncbi:fucose-1-phosphate guanylyltransferase [Protopterus annectens]|uniref:fucose-1-phosphate guanylyltransferase n=1 Tax=Protopterus annectens TaxID=7888 RepID=UPI001CFA0DCE|nr:fucose-1-phosphate guanylyltransferase [Protopterus annectens]
MTAPTVSVQNATRERLNKYDRLRGREVNTGEFWDVVVITAADKNQELAYQLQIKDKLRRKELPLGLNYLVFADPPGAKIVLEAHIKFDKCGFTALAHPSSLAIGTTHGVFVLEPTTETAQLELEYRTCHRFLHKPSIEEMHTFGAVCKTSQNFLKYSSRENYSILRSDSEFVYTDSTYYFDQQTAKVLLALFNQMGGIHCEIDAYGDFLQALGPGASSEYTRNLANVSKEEPQLVAIREKIFFLLKGTPLNIIALNNSRFYHIGTTQEYLFNFTSNPDLRAELNLLFKAFCISLSAAKESGNAVCVIHSIIESGCSVASGTVIEYSRLGRNVSVGNNTIISGCWINHQAVLPPNCFLHSICVKVDGKSGFVTIAFSIDDNLKKSVDCTSKINLLQFFGVPLTNCLEKWGLSDSKCFSEDTKCMSLWNAHLFPLCTSLPDSVMATLKMVNALQNSKTFQLAEEDKLLSVEESIFLKDVVTMLKFREELCEEIGMQLQKLTYL